MLRDAERKAERDSIAKIEAYKKVEKWAYRKIEQEREADPERTTDHSHWETKLDQDIQNLQSELLEIEMKLQDALKAATRQFFSRINQIIEEMKTCNQDYIGNVLAEVINFNEKFKEAAQHEYEKFHQHAQSVPEDDLIRENEGNENYVMYMLMDLSELETLVTVLESFKENTENKISNFESQINGDITKDWKETSNNIEQMQHTRNRDII